MRRSTLDAVLAAAELAATGEEPEPIPVELRGGRIALLRPIRPDDRERLQRGLEWLSPRSRYLAFHDRLDRLTDEQLRYVTEIDHRDHVAWIVLDPDDPDAPGMGLGRYVRLTGQPKVAEAAITVLDAHQGLGLGTLLLAVLAHVARANDIEVFRNYVLVENETMLELFDQLGATRQRMTDTVEEVDFALPDDPDELPDTPAGRAMRAFAEHREDAPRLAFTLPPVWMRRRRRSSTKLPPITTGGGWDERGDFASWLDDAFGTADDTFGTADDALGADDDADPSVDDPET